MYYSAVTMEGGGGESCRGWIHHSVFRGGGRTILNVHSEMIPMVKETKYLPRQDWGGGDD